MLEVSDYYDGSRLFAGLSDSLGMSLDQVNFVISQLAALLLAVFFRTTFHPYKASATARHGYGLICALLIGYFCFGSQAIHLALLPTICYAIIRTQSPHIVQRIILVVSLVYLSTIHLYRQIYDYGSYSLDITGPLMVVTQKVTSLAFSLHDGHTKDINKMTKMQRTYAISWMPTPLEYFGYILQFPTMMAGPAIFFKDYMDFINGSNLLVEGSSVTISEKPGACPNPMRAVIRKVLLSFGCAIIFVKLRPQFAIDNIKDELFLSETGLLYKFWYLNVCTTLVRFKYYFAWTLADAICNNSGMGIEQPVSADSQNSGRWDQFSNVNIFKFEFGTNLRECIEAWNICTNRWLRLIVYDRVSKYATILTYSLSALWHGFYPGYYITFANGALFTVAARIIRRHCRDHFMSSTGLKRLYDLLTFITTKLLMAYLTFTFVLLEFWWAIRVYIHMYWCFHVLAVGAIVLVPYVVPKARPYVSSKTDKMAEKQSVSQPIANGVSR